MSTISQRLREIKRLADDETTPTHELVEKIGLVALLALRELEASPSNTGTPTDTQRIEWMFSNCQDKSAEDLEFENPDAWRAWVDAAMEGAPS